MKIKKKSVRVQFQLRYGIALGAAAVPAGVKGARAVLLQVNGADLIHPAINHRTRPAI